MTCTPVLTAIGAREVSDGVARPEPQSHGLDYVDVFYSHRFDPDTPLEETLQALVDIVRRGKALYAGISRWPLEATRFALDYLRRHDTPCLLYQGRLNMIDREPADSGVLDEVASGGAGFVSFSPLAQGLLTDRYLKGIPADSRIMTDGRFLKENALTEQRMKQIRALNDLAAQRGQTLAQMALAWVLHDGRRGQRIGWGLPPGANPG